MFVLVQPRFHIEKSRKINSALIKIDGLKARIIFWGVVQVTVIVRSFQLYSLSAEGGLIRYNLGVSRRARETAERKKWPALL